MALLIVAVALLVGFGAFVVREWRVEREEMVERRTAIASVMAANVSAPLIYDDRASAHLVLRSARGVSDVRSVTLFDDAGQVFARHGTSAVAPASPTVVPVWRFDRDALEVRVPVRVDGEPVGQLVMVSSLEGLYEMFLGYALFAGLVFLAVAGGAVRAATTLARRVIEPVNALSAAMKAVRESGDFAQPVQPGPDTELAGLAYEFNALLAELARRNAALVAARDEADAGSRLKTEFLANMSHELRTPLNAVVGLTPLLASEPLTPTQREYLGVIERSAENLLQLLNDILDVAKLEAGRLVLEETAFDLRALMAETCAVFGALAAGKGVQFDLEVSESLASEYVGDPLRLKQIVTNLVSNAVKFTPAGAVRVSLEPEGPSGMLKLVVADTGVGVPQERLPALFEKFVQADSSTTRKYGGSGLGLAICRELAELMGGDMQVQSRPGHGSIFTARFAMQPRAHPTARDGALDLAPAESAPAPELVS